MGADALGHGCTGRGNDQLRFEAIFRATELRVVAPMRDLELSREWEIDYARDHGIDVPVTRERPWSIDENFWSRSIEGGLPPGPVLRSPSRASPAAPERQGRDLALPTPTLTRPRGITN